MFLVQMIVVGFAWFSPADASEDRQNNYFQIEYNRSISSSDHVNIGRLNGLVLRYIPDNMLIVKMEQAAINVLQSLNGVVSARAIETRDKIAGNIDWSRTQSLSAEVLRIQVYKAESLQTVLQIIEQRGLIAKKDIIRTTDRAIVALVSGSQIQQIAQIHEVEFIQKEPRLSVSSGSYDGDAVSNRCLSQPAPGFENGVVRVGFPLAWIRGLTGQGQRIAMADTGLDSGQLETLHSSLKGKVRSAQNFALFGSGWADTVGHGTMVGNLMVGLGPHGLMGGSYGAQLVVQSIWSGLNLILPPGDLKDLFAPAFAQGARIHVNAWLAEQDQLTAYDLYAEQIDDFVYQNPEFLILFASGNQSANLSTVSTPGIAKNILTVGSSYGPCDLRGKRGLTTPWTAVGPLADGRRKPELVAPGSELRVLRSKLQPNGGRSNPGETQFVSGTSFSLPLVASAAAIARQQLQRRTQRTPSAALLKGLLMHSGRSVVDSRYPELDVGRLVRLIGSKKTKIFWGSHINVSQTGEVKEHVVQIEKPGQKLKLTMTYSDLPASASASRALVNNLDVSVEDSSGTVLASGTDALNNDEQLTVHGLQVGTLKIKVIAKNLPLPLKKPQEYALVLQVEDDL